MPTSYYTNPSSAGYHQQKLGGICERCGKQFKFSGAQLNNITNITCPYCQHSGNLREASARWVNTKQRMEQQQTAELLGSAITGFANGYTGNKTSYKSSYNSNSGGCSSDFACGVGMRCVKERYNSTGVCMKTVNEYGTQTYNSPSLDSVGVNMDEGCSFDTECPIGFRCIYASGACVKR